MRLALASIFVLSLVLPVPAQECFDYGTLCSPDLGTFPCDGSVVVQEATGSNLCLAVRTTDGDRLVWTSVADGPEPVLLGSYPLPGRTVRTLHIAGTRAAVCFADGGWMVVDFQFPGSPMLAGQLAGVGCREVDVRDDWVIAAEYPAGLGIYELGGGAPVERARIDPGPAYAVDVDGDLCCFVGHRPWVDGDDSTDMYGYMLLVALDLADPGAPAEIGRREYGLGYSYNTTIHPIRCSGTGVMAVRNDELIGPDGGGAGPASTYSKQLLFFDTTAATGMTDAGSLDLVQATDVPPPPSPCIITGGRSHVLSGGILHYLRKEAGSWVDAGRTLADVACLAGNSGYVWGGREEELVALVPQLAGGSPTLGTARAGSDDTAGLRSVDGFLFLSSMHDGTGRPGGTIEGWIHVLNAADPLNLDVDHIAAAGEWMVFDRYAVLGDHLYSAHGIWNWRDGSMGGGPFDSYATIGGAGHAVWTTHSGFLRSYDVSDPLAPQPVGDFLVGDSVSAVAVDSDRAVFASGNQVIAVDVSDPGTPVEIGRATVDAPVRELVLDGETVVASNGTTVDVLVLDRLSGELARTGQVDLGNRFRMAYAAPVVYAAVDAAGVAAVDVSSPASPARLGAFAADVGPAFNGAAILGDVLYVDDGNLQALRIQCSPAVPVAIGELELVWADGACRLSWTMDARAGGVRVLASAGGRSWVVPWESRDGRNVAVDGSAPVGTTVIYAVQTYGETGWVTVAERSVQVPASPLALNDPVPNPFNPETVLRYTLDRGGHVELMVFDAAGRRVRTLVAKIQAAGPHAATWDGADDGGRAVPAGVYFARLRTGSGVRTTKLMLLK